MKPNITTRLLLLAAGVAAAPLAMATNGMDLIGYGPISEALGGTSYAYDNGTAAMQNNPATLSLMEDDARLDISVGALMPTIGYTPAPGAKEEISKAKLFLMPAIGYARKGGNLTYGLGVMAQGGMGTDWGTKLSGGSNYENFSNIQYAKLIVPLSYQVTDDLAVGAALNYGQVALAMKMLASSTDGFSYMDSTTQSAYGTMLTTYGYNPQAMHLDFAGGNKATGTGYGVRLGATLKLGSDVVLGAMYNSKSQLNDLKGKVTMTMDDFAGNTPVGGAPMKVTGDIALPNFQWPDSYGIGASVHLGDLMLTADYERINWSKTMDTFDAKITKVTNAGGTALPSINMSLPLHWKDQNVIKIGAQYRMDTLSLRVGANLANNPVPDGYANPLLPAIYQNHLTAGIGLMLGKNDSLDLSGVYAFKVTTTNNYTPPGSASTVSGTSSAAGGSAQIMYSHLF